MKKFKYRAESYLKYLVHMRTKALRELKKAEAYRDQLVREYYGMESKVKTAYKINSEVGQEGRDIEFINDNNLYIKMLKIQMENLSTEIESAEAVFQEKHQELLKLQLQVKKIELHKEAEFAKYKKELKKKSQKMTDEINGTRRRVKHAESI